MLASAGVNKGSTNEWQLTVSFVKPSNLIFILVRPSLSNCNTLTPFIRPLSKGIYFSLNKVCGSTGLVPVETLLTEIFSV